jgi:hypothetical protein
MDLLTQTKKDVRMAWDILELLRNLIIRIDTSFESFKNHNKKAQEENAYQFLASMGLVIPLEEARPLVKIPTEIEKNHELSIEIHKMKISLCRFSKISAADFYRLYQAWCALHNSTVFSQKNFGSVACAYLPRSKSNGRVFYCLTQTREKVAKALLDRPQR